MGSCSSVTNKPPNSIVDANKQPSQTKPASVTPQPQPAQQTYSQPPAQNTNNYVPVQPSTQQDPSQYRKIQPNPSEAQVQIEQQSPKLHMTGIKSSHFTLSSPGEEKPIHSFGVSKGERKLSQLSDLRESRDVRQSYGGRQSLHLHTRTKGEGMSYRSSMEGYIEGKSREIIHPNEVSGISEAQEIGFTEEGQEHQGQKFLLQQEIYKIEEGLEIQGKQKEEPQELLQCRETLHGVSYEVGEVSKVLKSVTITVADAKAFISAIDENLRRERKHLKAITVRFDVDETENMDYFIYEVFRTSAYRSFNLSLETLAIFSERALQGFSGILASNPLEKLSIMYSQADATDNFFATILSGVKINNASLKLFRLDFIECPGVSDEAIKYVKQAVESNQALEHFAVYFGKTRKITNQSIVYIRAALLNKPNLKILELGFQQMPQLTDAVLPMFTDIIKSLPNLQFLDINTPNAGYSEAAFNHFEAFIRTLPSQNVTLTWKESTYAEF